MSETLETVLRASVRTLAAAAGLSPSRMHQLGKLTVLQTPHRNAVSWADVAVSSDVRTYLARWGTTSTSDRSALRSEASSTSESLARWATNRPTDMLTKLRHEISGYLTLAC